jgi:hypothetical protein
MGRRTSSGPRVPGSLLPLSDLLVGTHSVNVLQARTRKQQRRIHICLEEWDVYRSGYDSSVYSTQKPPHAQDPVEVILMIMLQVGTHRMALIEM